MIVVALGANLPSPVHGPPRAVLEAALARLPVHGATVLARSRWYESAPVPVSDQPWYVNGVAAVETTLTPQALLAALHAVEQEFGRTRRTRNEARILDLDVVAYHDRVMAGPPILPHPRLHERAFVLLPLRDVAPGWRHPATGRSIAEMLGDLPPGQETRVMAE